MKYFSFSFLINSILIILIYNYFLNSYLSPIFAHIKEKGIKANIFTYIAEIYDNLTIYKEKYLKNVEDFRYFKNGDIYSGEFNKGKYNGIGIYYKRGAELPFHIYSFFLKLNSQIPRKIDKSFLIYYGNFKNDYFISGFYVDIVHQIIYSGEWENNTANGKGMIYFSENCTINGVFLQNSLINRTNCSCPQSFCDLFYYFKINTENFETNKNIDWDKTLKYSPVDKYISFNRNILTPLIWILYILFKEKILNFLYILIHKNFIYKKKTIRIKKSNYYKNKNIINEGIISDRKGSSIKEEQIFLFKSQNSVFRVKYRINNNQNIIGTCFICKIILDEINLETLCLFTNNHILPNIEEKTKYSSIKISLKNDFKKKSYIEINKQTNLILSKSLDYAFIEIKKDTIKEDKMKEEGKQKEPIELDINKENKIKPFFEIDPYIFKEEYENNDYLNTEARLSGFPLGKKIIMKEDGNIFEIDKKYNFKFYHNINTSEGNSGSPICKKNSYLIGIHCAFFDKEKKNIGTFFKDILIDIKEKYVKNTLQNQPIFGREIGFFCELKSINFCFLLVKYEIYEKYVKNKDILEFETILNEKKEINLELKRYIFPSNIKRIEKLAKEKNFAIIEILKEDNINYFFHFNKIDEKIILKRNEKYYEYMNEKKKLKIEIVEQEQEALEKEEDKITREDFFNSIENTGYNVNTFEPFCYYTKEKEKMKSCYIKVQEVLDIFMENIIENLFSQIDRKKYYPKYNYLKISFRIIIFIFLTLFYLIGFFKYDYKKQKKEIKNFSLNLFYSKKANFEIKNNSILIIKKGIFNKIDLDYPKRKMIKSILIEKGSKIEGNCSLLFSNFINCRNIQIENLDTSNTINMENMFFSNKNLEYLNFKNFNTSNTENMNGMFYKCEKIKKLDLSSFITSKTISMDNMFRNCFSLIELNISSFDTKNTKSMNYMFDSCFNLNQLDLSSFNTSNVESMEYMFALSFSIQKLDLSNFNTSKVKNMFGIFSHCKSLIELDLSYFDTSNVEKMDKMFYGCESLEKLNLSNFDTSNIKNMEKMFCNCKSLKNLDLSYFNTSIVEKMDNMFYGCKSLINLNLSNFDTSHVKNMEQMFYGCESLKKLNLSNFKTLNVVSMKGMFSYCKSLNDLEINNFNTKNVIDMSFMFASCNNLESLNLSNFITINAKKMNKMFYNCSSLKILDISNFIDLGKIDLDRIFEFTSSNLIKKYNKEFGMKLKKFNVE